ncbi:MAG: hypothetical protein ACR2P4_05820 [Gammaproteobacteria bacterium]
MPPTPGGNNPRPPRHSRLFRHSRLPRHSRESGNPTHWREASMSPPPGQA